VFRTAHCYWALESSPPRLSEPFSYLNQIKLTHHHPRSSAMVQDWTRDTLTRHQSFPQPRGPHGPDLSDQRRFYEAPETFRHQPPMAIDTALRSHCGIWAKQYFVAVLMDDGTPTTFFSPGQKLNDSTLHQFFNPQKFQQIASQIDRSKSHCFPRHFN
jgi:hypothetical protein